MLKFFLFSTYLNSTIEMMKITKKKLYSWIRWENFWKVPKIFSKELLECNVLWLKLEFKKYIIELRFRYI